MFSASTKYQVHLVEGYPYRAQQQTIKALEFIASGVIGRVRLIQASFGFKLAAGPNIRVNWERISRSIVANGVASMSARPSRCCSLRGTPG